MFLNRIVETKKSEVEQLQKHLNVAQAEADISTFMPVRSLRKAITTNRNRGVGLIAEVKKASPSKGIIREQFNPVEIAQSYVQAGADALSVLTDVSYFQGGIDIFKQVRSQVDVPMLRKDFIISREQLLEARLIGADAVLLIAAILDDEQLKELFEQSRELGMEALIEVHEENELHRVLKLEQVELIGINNRNLHTFVTDLAQTDQLRKLVPNQCTLVSESGIHLPEHIAHLYESSVDAVLIGEHFMRNDNIGEAVHKLMEPVEQTPFASESVSS
ncbi:indole-3-glycerol phosphate synthase TrpC [Paenibacillus sp. SC116]|uniref:indole-3-glycerol phosphate synthase TrpC n=1 Tax=Paenibacillus sp. SC116 TaxID=2968986 RepID=UPI00215B30E9|nr:indole-3-glycerol phosphate synthase TrpC [Paenibacillus sp. SC116]MCR8842955.1 indole-3-glycerol phosphate synthase TrpC [Paenibacillus sp. SC116]